MRTAYFFAFLGLCTISCRKDEVAPTGKLRVEYRTKILITGFNLYKYSGKEEPTRIMIGNVVRVTPADTSTLVPHSVELDLPAGDDYVIQFVPNALGPKLVKVIPNQIQEYKFN